MDPMPSKAKEIGLLIGVLLIFLVGLFMEPIPQHSAYHHFADQRPWLGVPNAWNVLSNLVFFLVGAWGLFLLLTPDKVRFIDNRERWPWVGVALGLILTSLGSAYYHLDPNNASLVWDRLFLTIVFVSYAMALISERVNVAFGLWLWPLMLIFGFYTVWFWNWSELHGHEDLRPYFGIQAFVILTTFVMAISPSPYNRNGYLSGIIILFFLARLAELYDHQVYEASHWIISGHTLKHFLAALTAFLMFWMLRKRRIIRMR